MPRYFVSPDGGSVEINDGPFAASAVPEGWEEVTADQYQAHQEQMRQAAFAAAAAFIAADGDVPSGPVRTTPIEDLPTDPGDDHNSDQK
ncbi:hypothetical protein AB0N14_18025 [Streptomyces sp. NPDC051104]|uniref:hypothetical protein n=1 Tax=Streptomyces sp. NPDC051104 TaxID=3155044 RepID=UPI00341F6540